MTPYYDEDGVTLYLGDSREIAPALTWDAVVTDPPWGNDTATDSRRFTRAISPWWDAPDSSLVRPQEAVTGDKEPFDPKPWIGVPACLWGANHFAADLPASGGWLIWDKRLGAEDLAEKGWPLGEAELAWTNLLGATRVFRKLWSGLLRTTERGEFYHPTQKPVALMTWCLRFVPLSATVVLDPFMGSGSTLVAAKNLGRRAIGIEVKERYCEIAVRRLAQGVLSL